MNVQEIKNLILNKIKGKSNWLVGRKIFLSFAIIIVIFIAIIAVQIFGLHKFNDTIKVNNEKFSNAVNIKEAEKLLGLFQVSLKEKLSYSEDYYSNLDGILEGQKSSMFAMIESVEKNSDNDEIKKKVINLKKSLTEYFQLSKDYLLLRKGNNIADFERKELEKNILGNNIYSEMSAINNILSAEYKAKSQDAMNSANFVLRIAIISVIIGTVLGAALAFFLNFHINGGIKNLLENISTSINYILSGDFKSRIDTNKINNEFTFLAPAIYKKGK